MAGHSTHWVQLKAPSRGAWLLQDGLAVWLCRAAPSLVSWTAEDDMGRPLTMWVTALPAPEGWAGLGARAAAARGSPVWGASPDRATRGLWCQHERGECSVGGITGHFPKGVQKSDSVGKTGVWKEVFTGDGGLLELLGGAARRLCRHRSSPPLVGQGVDFEQRQTQPRTNYVTVSISSACSPDFSLQVNWLRLYVKATYGCFL